MTIETNGLKLIIYVAHVPCRSIFIHLGISAAEFGAAFWQPTAYSFLVPVCSGKSILSRLNLAYCTDLFIVNESAGIILAEFIMG